MQLCNKELAYVLTCMYASPSTAESAAVSCWPGLYQRNAPYLLLLLAGELGGGGELLQELADKEEKGEELLKDALTLTKGKRTTGRAAGAGGKQRKKGKGSKDDISVEPAVTGKLE